MTDAKERKATFLECIDALLEHVKINTRMDIRDRIAALSLCDRVVAREKTDDDAERAGSKVREYAPTLQATPRAGQGDRRSGTRDTRDTRDDEPDDATADDTDADAGIPVSH